MERTKIILLMIITIGTSSCGNNFLEVTPLNQLSDKIFWKTESDAELALNGCYNSWETSGNILFGDAMTDNGYDQFNYGYQLIGNGQITPSNGGYTNGGILRAGQSSAQWFSYERIRKYNTFLAKIGSVNMDSDEKEEFKAEIRFLRAYDYFNKVMYYGDIPLVTKLIPPSAKPERDPASEVEQFILKELDTVSTILPVENCITSKGHVTAGAALALKARLELYMGKYEEAMKDAKAVIDMKVYELYPDYRGLFLAENNAENKEAILDIEFMKNEYSNGLPQLLLPATDLGWSALNGTKGLADTYEMLNGKLITDPSSGYDPADPYTNRDPRLSMTMLCPGQKWNGRYYNPLDKTLPDGNKNPDFHELAAASRGGYCVIKYVEPMSIEDMNNYDGNIMVIRLAEMYLTYAEGAVETGTNKDLGLEYLNLVRARVGMPPVQVLTMDAVRYERRVEFAFEGLRYFDIKRWDLGPQVMNGPLYGCPNGTVNISTGELTLSSGYIKLEDRHFHPDRKYLLPIPQAEIDANPNMKQNPGY